MSNEYLKCDNGHFFEKSSTNRCSTRLGNTAKAIFEQPLLGKIPLVELCFPFLNGYAAYKVGDIYVCPKCGSKVSS
jgi:hypothetical protein